MLSTEDVLPKPSPLRTIIPIVTVLGLLGYLVFELTAGQDRATFYQVGAVVALLVYILTFVDIILGIAILIACVGMSPEMTIGDMGNLRLEDFIVPVLLVAWFSRAGRNREPFAKAHLKIPILFYFAAMIFASILEITIGKLNETLAIFILGKNVEYYLIFLIILNNVKTEGELKALVVFSLLVAAVSSTFGFGRFFAPPETQIMTRVGGPLGETANIFAGYLIMNIFVLIGLYLHAQTTPQRLASAAGMIVIGISILFSYSRTSYVALGAGLGIFGILKERRLLVLLLILAVLFPLIAPDTVWTRAQTIGLIVTEAGPESWVARVNAWKNAVEKLAANPLFGKGLGAVPFGDVDNEYVRVAADVGMVGLALFVWFLIRIGRTANRAYNLLPPGTFVKGYTAGYMMAFFGIVVHAIGATSFSSIRTMEQFMILTGLSFCILNNAEAWGILQAKEKPLPSQHGAPMKRYGVT